MNDDSSHEAPHVLLELLLGAELVRMSALLLAAVHRTLRKPRVAAAAHHLVAVVLACEHGQGGLDDATTEAEHQVKRGLFLDVVVRQGSSILQLFAREDEALLVWRNALFVLDLGLHIVDGIRRFHVERDRLTRESLHENLHRNSTEKA